MLILGLEKTTLLDYPGHVAATVFAGGCNFRCPFCHNREIVLKSANLPPYNEGEILSFLEKRKHVLTGVCVSGGEPSLYSSLPDFIKKIKQLGYLVKLDTNGSNPVMLERLIAGGLIDCCAMDIKNSPEKYSVSVGFETAPGHSFDLSPMDASVKLLMSQQTIPYEFRTTVVKELHEESDMEAIGRWIAGAHAYFLQSYSDSDGVMCRGFHAHTEDTLKAFEKICRRYIPNTSLRGI